MITDAPWYVPNIILRQDLQITSAKEEIRRFSTQYRARLYTHPNNLTVPREHRRLRRHLPIDLPHQARNPNNYGRALMSDPPQAIAPNPHTNLLKLYIQFTNKMGLNRKKFHIAKQEDCPYQNLSWNTLGYVTERLVVLLFLVLRNYVSFMYETLLRKASGAWNISCFLVRICKAGFLCPLWCSETYISFHLSR
jgi:hypothetical protein